MTAFARRIRRLILGPDAADPDIAYEAARHPLPLTANTTAPTDTHVTWALRPHIAGQAAQSAADAPGHPPRPDVPDNPPDPAVTATAARAIGSARVPEPVPNPTVTITHPAGDPAMPDDLTETPTPVSAPPKPDGPAPDGPEPDPYDTYHSNMGDNGDQQDNPVADSGVHHLTALPAADLPTITVDCTACEGAGHVTRTVNSLLRDTVAMIPVDGGDQVIREFYRRLLSYTTKHPDGTVKERIGLQLAPLFPRDLLTAATQDGASPGAMQRDKLLHALIAVSELYGGSPDDMDRLDTAIGVYGRSHAAFQRPDGTVRGATEEEYEAVIDVYLGLLAAAFGQAFTAAHEQVWSDALRYVKVGMLWAQYHSQARAARYPRRDGHHA